MSSVYVADKVEMDMIVTYLQGLWRRVRQVYFYSREWALVLPSLCFIAGERRETATRPAFAL